MRIRPSCLHSPKHHLNQIVNSASHMSNGCPPAAHRQRVQDLESMVAFAFAGPGSAPERARALGGHVRGIGPRGDLRPHRQPGRDQ